MTDYPQEATREWNDFAIIGAEVRNFSALDGDAGTSEFVIDMHAGAGLATVEEYPDKAMSANSPRLTFRFTGSSEHRLIIESLRFIADQLEEFTGA